MRPKLSPDTWNLLKLQVQNAWKNEERTFRTPQNTSPYTFSNHFPPFGNVLWKSENFENSHFCDYFNERCATKGDQNFFLEHFFTFLDHFFDQSVAFWGVLEFFLEGPRGVLRQKFVLNRPRTVSRPHKFFQIPYFLFYRFSGFSGQLPGITPESGRSEEMRSLPLSCGKLIFRLFSVVALLWQLYSFCFYVRMTKGDFAWNILFRCRGFGLVFRIAVFIDCLACQFWGSSFDFKNCASDSMTLILNSIMSQSFISRWPRPFAAKVKLCSWKLGFW